MNILNFEFKANVERLEKHENKLLSLHPKYGGLDHQTDTYFQVRHGRLKLREGNIENALISYEREDITGSRISKILLYKYQPNRALKEILARHLGVKVIVEKRRKIYYIGHVKFHFDDVKGLGLFIEVEVIDDKKEFTVAALKAQCDKYFNFFEPDDKDLVAKSYSDLLLGKAGS